LFSVKHVVCCCCVYKLRVDNYSAGLKWEQLVQLAWGLPCILLHNLIISTLVEGQQIVLWSSLTRTASSRPVRRYFWRKERFRKTSKANKNARIFWKPTLTGIIFNMKLCLLNAWRQYNVDSEWHNFRFCYITLLVVMQE
jgi:hypothetical protein